ncbi:GspH/FimT family pseudopilin [Microbulbifer agarilyticus]|uniref:GspH/FimT family pseudopilin n=1 Tax=Microbulbifer agarilyticus TaxID=260552 RepID=UPI000986C350|nr:GspH/FimT family pseudopilin [Microbulbifer agarilyticus]
MHQRGLTLIELLITCSVLGVLLAIGIPSFQQQLEANRTRVAADTLLQAIHLTRSKAISTNRRATLRRLDTWHAGWEVFYDRDFDGERDTNEQQITSASALDGVTINGNGPLADYISFIGSGESRYAGTASGGGFQAGTFTICPTTPGEGYQLILARSGRVRIDRAAAADCE